MDPSFEQYGNVTTHSDAYSFGVLLLEVVCGVAPILIGNPLRNSLIENVQECHGRSAILDAADKRLRGKYNILVGIASGLDYLHNQCMKTILHRDIKPANVMLDMDFNAKLCDFGLATQLTCAATSRSTNNIFGTQGYMDPSFQQTGKVTRDSDVYSFGVLPLELVRGCYFMGQHSRGLPRCKIRAVCDNKSVILRQSRVWASHFSIYSPTSFKRVLEHFLNQFFVNIATRRTKMHSREEKCKQLDLEKKKAGKKAEFEKAKGELKNEMLKWESENEISERELENEKAMLSHDIKELDISL
nr:leucine-rich repeat receptor-like serine/threonine-protein kinase BAM2 [Aegilops tauschii subsp. strangulata]